MKKYGKMIWLMSLLLSGSFVFCGGVCGRVARSVEIEGVNIGAMTYAKAEAAVRAKIAETLPPLTVHSPNGDFPVGGLCFCDNVSALVRSAKRGERLSAKYTRTWADMEEFLWQVCEKNAKPCEDATLSFSANGFCYTAEKKGICCDYAALLEDATNALSGGGREITLRTREYGAKITEEQLRARSAPLARFSTRYDAGNLPRSHNIALACARISGTTVKAHEEFSFNRTVGARTRENGFEVATVIQDGQFLPGVGGGVCQVSTTLFNAALRSGMTVTESRAHSLSVSYVAPSLDAMVSSCSDLKFVNPYDEPVYILAKAERGVVSFELFGLSDGRRYVTESTVLLRVPPPAPKIVEGDEDGVIRAEKEGIASESYLFVYEGERLVSKKRIRKDSYAAVQGILRKAAAQEPKEELPGLNGETEENFSRITVKNS